MRICIISRNNKGNIHIYKFNYLTVGIINRFYSSTPTTHITETKTYLLLQFQLVISGSIKFINILLLPTQSIAKLKVIEQIFTTETVYLRISNIQILQKYILEITITIGDKKTNSLRNVFILLNQFRKKLYNQNQKNSFQCQHRSMFNLTSGFLKIYYIFDKQYSRIVQQTHKQINDRKFTYSFSYKKKNIVSGFMVVSQSVTEFFLSWFHISLYSCRGYPENHQ
eukprot:TRINITY_DN10816_c1_g1_i2.p1 TRINITY_DN10816_c1_g1~~TRINITY_DN10816_c1_g1_i2.p1  ORF type:complete len:225 (+),score=-10.69 TRINITY_DN10816_c1_g1_i2:503-1177(+)